MTTIVHTDHILDLLQTLPEHIQRWKSQSNFQDSRVFKTIW